MGKLFLKSKMANIIAIMVLLIQASDVLAVREGAFETVAKKFEQTEQKPSPEAAIFARPSVEYTSRHLRDPFQGVTIKPPADKQNAGVKQAQPLPPMDVQGIVWGGNFNQAIINNKVVKSGDTIEGAKVVSIEKNKIILLFDGVKYDLSPAGTQPAKTDTKK